VSAALARVDEIPAANEPDPTLAGVLRAVTTLTAEVVALRADVAALRSPAPPPRLISLRQAARILGISRTRTLPALMRDRRIRVVRVNGRPKIPMEEIARIGREGASDIPTGKATRPAPVRSQAPLARDLV
jgi:hypothetical protein